MTDAPTWRDEFGNVLCALCGQLLGTRHATRPCTCTKEPPT